MTTAAPAIVAVGTRFNWRAFFQQYGLLLAFYLLCLGLALATDKFLDGGNLFNVLRQATINGIIAVGMMLVILTRGIDLSVGSILALASLITADAVQQGWPPLPALVLALSLGGLLGLVNGLIVAWVRIPPFIITLGMMTTARGLAKAYTDGRSITGFDDAYRQYGVGVAGPLPVSVPLLFSLLILLMVALVLYFNYRSRQPGQRPTRLYLALGMLCWAPLGLPLLVTALQATTEPQLLEIPVPVIIAAGVFVGGYVLLELTPLGRHIFALGDNERAAHLTGLATRRVTTFVYMAAGALSALAGVILMSRLNSVDPARAGEGAEFDAIAAVVVGGTSFSGGEGTVTGTLIGVLIIAVLNNGLNLLDVQAEFQGVVKGVVIALALLLHRAIR